MNRIKGTLARLGIRNFRPTLRNAAEHLAGLYTPEGTPLPPKCRSRTGARHRAARLGDWPDQANRGQGDPEDASSRSEAVAASDDDVPILRYRPLEFFDDLPWNCSIDRHRSCGLPGAKCVADQLSRNLIPFSVREELLPLPASNGRCC